MRPLARKALEVIQQQGGRVINRDLIETTLKEIGQAYRPGLISWIKEDRGRWRRLLQLEDGINRTALQGDEKGLTKALREYEGFLLQMVKAFKTPIGETGNLF